jgi:hypothetical protein
MKRALVAAAIVCGAARAFACADCLLHTEIFVGVDEAGEVATVSTESTGESDFEEVWVLRVQGASGTVCSVDAEVEKKSVGYIARGGKDCEAILGLRAMDRVHDEDRPVADERRYAGRHLERAAFVAKVAARFSPALTRAPSPACVGIEPVANADGYDGEQKQQPLTIDGVQVGHVTAGASQWAIASYTHPRFDGIIVRMITMIDGPEVHLGSSSGCTDYFDGYLPVTSARIAAARLIAQARKAPTPAESLAFAQQAVAADPPWSGAQNELRRRQGRRRSTVDHAAER